ncbi:acyl-CoA dehydratase activase-related protein [Caldovatus sediminis]|uniref:acyl-CoA dehydratase activase-related protein n=1 Tax=Caldovatus sediminis TaxID=2041189 RepID=UPI00166513D1|nr:acyl-CoA dehydratase activase-related protein [Caldovatus sediminis]
MFIQTLESLFGRKPSAAPGPRPRLRIGIPRTLNIWSTHQFWIGLFEALGIEARSIVFSSDTSEEQGREFGRGRGTVDCCYPVKCMSGHYGELIFGQKRRIDVLFSPMIYSLPSMLHGHVADSLACPRVMAAPENIRAGFTREKDVFAEQGIRYLAPLVSLGDPRLVAKQLHPALAEMLPGLPMKEVQRAVDAGYQALSAFNDRLRGRSREILAWCAREGRPCILVLARPYHMDPGIGHEIETDLQAHGYPILWSQYLPTDGDLMDWLFGEQVRAGEIRSPFDIADVWPTSYSANTNEILWGAKFAARTPWITCVIRLTSYECGMDQPTYTPVQQTVERSGTLYFSFQDLDSTKPAGSVKIRVETIAYYLERMSADIIGRKQARMPPGCPLLG